MTQSSRNFYDILNVATDASTIEIKKSYTKLILKFHPDKMIPPDTIGEDPLKDENILFSSVVERSDSELSSDQRQFDLIVQAWKTLKDPQSRSAYDAELALREYQSKNNVYQTLRIADMSMTTDPELGRIYTFKCRCGGTYEIDEMSINQCFCIDNVATTGSDKESKIKTESDDYDDNPSEILIECSNCSLSITLTK